MFLGFSNAYINTAEHDFKDFLNASYIKKENPLTEWEFIWLWTSFLNVWSFGYLAGNLLTPLLCDNFGRKSLFLYLTFIDSYYENLGTLVASNTLNFLSSIIFTVTILLEIPEMLFVGRLICSTAASVSFAVLIIFLQVSYFFLI